MIEKSLQTTSEEIHKLFDSLKDYAKINSRDTIQRMNYQEMIRTYKDNIATFEKYVDFDKKNSFICILTFLMS